MPSLFKYPHVLIALVAFVIADLTVSLLVRVAERFGAVDRPGLFEYKTQPKAVPFIGGIGLFTGMIGAVFATLNWGALRDFGLEQFISQRETQLAMAILIGGSLIAVLGFIDDFKPINAMVKLVTLAVITLILTQFGLEVTSFGPWPLVAYAVTLLWVVGVVSAFNAIDNTDGVAGTTGASCAFWLFLIAWGTSASDAQSHQSQIAVALGGACLGFFRHNKPSARAYLGNCGAFTMGFLVAVLSISTGWTSDPVKSAVVPVMLLAYPCFDISYTVFMRWRGKIVRNFVEAVVVSGRDHTAHRLAAMGLSPWRVLGVIALLNGLGGLAAFWAVRLHKSDAAFWGIAGGVVMMYGVFGYVIRNAVDLSSKAAHISHRKPTGKVDPITGKIVRFDGVLPEDEPEDLHTGGEGNTRRLTNKAHESGPEAVTQKRPAR